jgi:hypothetical protein
VKFTTKLALAKKYMCLYYNNDEITPLKNTGKMAQTSKSRTISFASVRCPTKVDKDEKNLKHNKSQRCNQNKGSFVSTEINLQDCHFSKPNLLTCL